MALRPKPEDRLPPPTSAAEFEARWKESYHLEGFGLDLTLHHPCPGCAAPEFLVCLLLETERRWNDGATCDECGRTFRMESSNRFGTILGHLLQTGGPELADWYTPPIRRIV